jgi:hypothetical protein
LKAVVEGTRAAAESRLPRRTTPKASPEANRDKAGFLAAA